MKTRQTSIDCYNEIKANGLLSKRRLQAYQCRVTGRNVIEWDLTDKLPIDIKNTNKTKKQRLDDALNSLRELYKNKNICSDEDWKRVANLIKSI